MWEVPRSLVVRADPSNLTKIDQHNFGPFLLVCVAVGVSGVVKLKS